MCCGEALRRAGVINKSASPRTHNQYPAHGYLVAHMTSYRRLPRVSFLAAVFKNKLLIFLQNKNIYTSENW